MSIENLENNNIESVNNPDQISEEEAIRVAKESNLNLETNPEAIRKVLKELGLPTISDDEEEN